MARTFPLATLGTVGQTPAAELTYRTAPPGGAYGVFGGARGVRTPPTGRRRRRRGKPTAAAPRRTRRGAKRARRASGRPARLVKGSAAAKRYMAKLRGMRRK